jgi:LacI family transcriptional regulator, galactose operon repressor
MTSAEQVPTSRTSRRGARPTMRDVADQVGLSIKSVSRVLNGEAGVSREKAEQVVSIARELGFRRNDLARSLRRLDRTETIGVVVEHPATRFFDGLIRGINEVAGKHGALVLTATTHGVGTEHDVVTALSSRRVDGLIIAPSGTDQSYLRAERAADLPLVFVDQPPRGITADTVLSDNAGGGRLATQHLINHGHRRIGVVGSAAGKYTVRRRLTGYRDALAAAGVDGKDLIRLDCGDPAEAEAAAAELLQLPQPATALFALNSKCTIGVIRALQSAGLEQRIAVVGFDDFETADLLRPAITVITQEIEAIGRKAATQVFRRIEGSDAPLRTSQSKTHLVARGSGEIPGPCA